MGLHGRKHLARVWFPWAVSLDYQIVRVRIVVRRGKWTIFDAGHRVSARRKLRRQIGTLPCRRLRGKRMLHAGKTAERHPARHRAAEKFASFHDPDIMS